MTLKLQTKRIIALLLAAFIALPALGAYAEETASVPDAPISIPAGELGHYDYFTDVFANLTDESHVFKVVTYEDLVQVFRTAGTYAVLFGDPSTPSTQADIASINEAAKAHGIDKVYYFDTKLDGTDAIDIADSANAYAKYYNDVVAKYLTAKDAGGSPVGTSPASDVKNKTFLFVYDKDHKDGANSSPIVSFLKKDATDDLTTDGAPDAAKATAFQTEANAVFGAAASYDTINPDDFIAKPFNRNVKVNLVKGNKDPAQVEALPPIFGPSDGPLVFEHVTYPELVRLLASEGNYVILFGGSWCPNTQAIIHYINEYAHKYHVDKIYFWDPRLNSGVDVTKLDDASYASLDATAIDKAAIYDTHDDASLMVRDTSSAFASRYGKLITNYLTNIDPYTQNQKTASASQRVTFKDDNGNDVSVNKLQVPYLFTYNKDNKAADGTAAPLFGSIELMFSWFTINQPDSTDSTKLNPTQIAYRTALDATFRRLESTPSGLTGVTPTTVANADGRIAGIADKTLEYKKSDAADYTAAPAEGDAITGLTPGVYDVRYAVKSGFHTGKSNGTYATPAYPAGQSVQIVVPAYIGQQDAPLGLKGVAPTTADDNDGQITGVSADQEYKLKGADAYIPVTDTVITGLASGTYVVRYKAKEGYSASQDTEVVVPALGQQSSPTGLKGVATSVFGAADGKIQGITEGLEFKKADEEDSAYRPATGNELTDLAAGTYVLRYAAKDGFLAGPTVEVAVEEGNRNQEAPTGLTGVAPTSSANDSGKIAGTTAAQEYRVHGSETYLPATAPAVTGLAAGTYHVRYAAKTGYNASPDATVVVPAYRAPSTPSTPSTPTDATAPPADTGTTGGNGPTSVTVPAKTDAAAGLTTAAVTADAVIGPIDSAKKAAADGKPATVTFKIEAADTANAVDLSIPRAAFNQVASDTQAGVSIDYAGLGTVSFSADAIASIGAAADAGDIVIRFSKGELTEEGKQALGDRPVYEFTVWAGDSVVSAFGGSSVHIDLPYTLQPGEDPNAVIVYYVNEETGNLDTVRGQYNAATGSVELITKHFSQYIIGYNQVAFSDVAASSWYGDAVGYLAARSIATGTDDQHFSPAAQVTRGQFVVLLLKAYGVAPEVNAADNFSDAGDAYYTDYLAAAKRLGIATGSGDGKFAPSSAITRQELFTLLYRALNVFGELPTKSGAADVSSFSDAGQIAGYAQEAFKSLVESGAVSGSGGKLSPTAAATRAEVAQLLYNLLAK